MRKEDHSDFEDTDDDDDDVKENGLWNQVMGMFDTNKKEIKKKEEVQVCARVHSFYLSTP